MLGNGHGYTCNINFLSVRSIHFACINDVVMHFAALNAPFGGVGESGMGKYHGEDSFLTFSNRRAVLVSARHIDLPLRYPPFPPLGLLKKFM